MNVIPLRTKPVKSATSIIRLSRSMDEELGHLFLGQALKRIREFAKCYDPDANPIVMANELERDFTRIDAHDFFLVIAVRDLKVIGHFLSRAEIYYGRKYVYILQLDIFNARLTTEEIDSGMRMLREWQKTIGASGIRGGALTDAHVRFYRKFNFAPKWMLLEDKGGS